MTKNCLLKRVEKQEMTARDFGFHWEHFSQIIAQIRSECLEVKEAWREKEGYVNLRDQLFDVLIRLWNQAKKTI